MYSLRTSDITDVPATNLDMIPEQAGDPDALIEKLRHYVDTATYV